MKKVFFSWILIAVSLTVSAQGNSGLGFNYQAVVRGANGLVLSAQEVELRFSLAQGQHFTPECWVETRSVRTDDFGTVGVRIGNGTKSAGTAEKFEDVNFAAAHYWLKVEIKDGAEFRVLSHSALASVPYAETATNAGNGAPVGTIMPFAGRLDNIPAGWLLCNGRILDRNEYSELFAVIGTGWGFTTGSNFRVPDLRGVFLRGVDGATISQGLDDDIRDIQRDPDRGARAVIHSGGNSGGSGLVGTLQIDAIRNITGTFMLGGTERMQIADGAFYHVATGGNWGTGHTNGSSNPRVGFSASNVVPTGSDNRPVNVAVLYIIKY